MDNYSIVSKNPITSEQLFEFRQCLKNGPVLITTHDNPDPDALASGKAISVLINNLWGIPTELVYTGIVGRAENRSMLKLLTPEWRHVDKFQVISKFSAVVFIDCQPGLKTGVKIENNLPVLVIDHHYPITKNPNLLFTRISARISARLFRWFTNTSLRRKCRSTRSWLQPCF